MGWLHGDEDGLERSGAYRCPHGVDVAPGRDFCPECHKLRLEAEEREAAYWVALEEERLRKWRQESPLVTEVPIRSVEVITDFERGLTKWVPWDVFKKTMRGEWRYDAARKSISTPTGYPLRVEVEEQAPKQKVILRKKGGTR